MVGHEIGYLVDPDAASGHGYLAIVAPLAIAGAVLALWVSALSVLRRMSGGAPSVAALTAAQSGLYVGFEVGERVIGSTDSPLFSLPVAFGLLAQPAVAWIAVRALRFGIAAIAGTVIDQLVAPLAIPISWYDVPRGSAPTPILQPAPARGPPLVF